IGLNVFNQPDDTEPALAGTTARLIDLVPSGYSLDTVTRLVLRSVGRAHGLIRNDQFRSIADALNLHWSRPRLVSVTLTGRSHTFTGSFTGIDEAGRLNIFTDRHGTRAYDASQVS